MSGKKESRFEFLLDDDERDLLRRLAERRGVSQGNLLRSMIRRAAARAKI